MSKTFLPHLKPYRFYGRLLSKINNNKKIAGGGQTFLNSAFLLHRGFTHAENHLFHRIT